MKIDKEKLLFVHIPKTGGTSILNKLDQSMWKKTKNIGHDPLFLLEKNNDTENAFSFCVVRNPYTRTFSYYDHFKFQNNVECSFLDFLYILKRKEFSKNTPMMIFPQSFYVYNLHGDIGIDKIYNYEKFYEIEEDLNIKFDYLNKGTYSQKEYKDAFKDKNAIALVQELFSVDFINFDYGYDEL